ncbi:MAG: hypothetical protein CLLPBCKN_007216 [Chroococcidiopsis cubana SAG 39.79]|uniref:Uncharacterized protein n=1 Tax=Chroococcidiopsis cubana SAG 39.79 TaxID=388085 RepID=A0AB37URT1_9CYAN|nr:hypothetical protein [Chroococcidiopsis cubana]MDZ4877781.1 hypothetical protein [Chroococcidiopsis cubana SAG 39.79]PSB66615.1 hypothetical protein C7B79_00160 [Chroococcidiopsis cubana CCALA 043]PSB66652.1 hypothetical protein C7B79_00345 [Chroococcidiopsis cubana CCALA 043]RUT14061.1 hypothetical protein DSM107010_05440 [Chroococcidiopsis cubana SAG 39.79]
MLDRDFSHVDSSQQHIVREQVRTVQNTVEGAARIYKRLSLRKKAPPKVRIAIDKNTTHAALEEKFDRRAKSEILKIQTSIETSPNIVVETETIHAALWSMYGERVKAKVPAQKTLAVAQQAIREGHSPENTVKILSHDPEFQKLQQQNLDTAERYANLAVEAAQRKELVATSGQPQKLKQQQRSKNSQIERGL